MKYICTNDFPNPIGNPITLGDSQKHVTDANGRELKNHIHKGAQFSIGSATEFKDLSPAEKTLVAHLTVSGKIAEAKDATVTKINDEVKADKSRAKADAEKATSSAALSVSDVLKSLPELIAAAVKNAVPAPGK